MRTPNFDGGARPRGNAQQLMEKFLAMARDASSAGDRVLAENYFQHADHYYRVLNARFEQQNGQGNNQGGNPQQNNQQGQNGQNNSGRPQYPQNDDNRGNQYDRQGDQQGYDQPVHQSHQQQPAYVQPQQPQQQPQSPPQAEADIGLPPGILGEAAPALAAPTPEEAGEGEAPRPQQTRRHRGPPRERADAGAGE